MANFEIPDEVEFSEEIRKLESTDRAHADIFNEVIGKVFENTVSNRNAIQFAEIQTTTSKTLNRSKEGGLRFNKILGKSEQKTFSWIGKNLLNTNYLVEEVINGVTFTPVKDENGFLEYINVNGTASNDAIFPLNDDYFRVIGGQKYIINGCPTGGASNTYLIQSTGTTAGPSGTTGDSGSNTSPFYFGTDGAGIKFAIVIKNGVTVSNLKFYPMLRMAEIEDGSYEPFCGGSPVPNPIYQSELKEVVIRGIKTVGKNLYNYNDLYRTEHVDVNKANDGFFTINITDTSTAERYCNCFSKPSKLIKPKTTYTTFVEVLECSNIGFLANSYQVGVSNQCQLRDFANKITKSGFYIYKTTTTEIVDVKFLMRSYFIVAPNVTNAKAKVRISIFEGDISDEDFVYVPYQENSIEFSSPITLRGIGDTKDVLNRNGIERKIKNVVLDGSDDETWSLQVVHSNIFVNSLYGVNNNNKNNIGICNAYIKNNYGITTMKHGEFRLVDHLYFKNTNCTTLEDWKSLLNNNPITVDLALTESEFEELPIVDQIALNSLETFDHITYITVDSEIEAETEVEFGTSKNGAYSLKGMNIAERTELYAKNIVNGNEVEY